MPAEWADRFWAYREAMAQAQDKGQSDAGIGQTTQTGKIRKTRLM